MDGHVKVGGVWKKFNGMHVKVSGVWKEVTDAYIKVGGVWKQFYQNLALFAGGAIGQSFDSDPTSVSVGFRFNPDGTYERRTGGVWGGSTSWITGGNVPADVGDDYEIEVTWVSGDTEVEPALADGVYRTLDSIRTFDATASPGDFYSGSLTFTIREIADTSNNVTGSWTVATEDGS